MSHDLQMARGHGSGFNLAIGEPFFLQDTLLAMIRLTGDISKKLLYPEVGGDPELLKILKGLHSQYKHVVVTNGAKQALEACFYALKKLEGRTRVVHPVPYWPSYPTLAASRGLGFVPFTGQRRSEEIRVVTAPNNPDGSELFDLEPYDIWDAAYASTEIYGWSGTPPDHRIAVHSAAKALGLSGARVGWVCTNDENIAREVGHFVEITTSGVSVLSQMHVAGVFNGLFDPLQEAVMFHARTWANNNLRNNDEIFIDSIGRHCSVVDGRPKNRVGMFAFFRALNPDKFSQALKKADVRLVTGEACGMSEPGWYRMSMGHRNKFTRDALTALRTAYDGI